MMLLIARLLRQRAAAANRSRRTAQWVVHCCAAQLSDSLRYCFAYTTRVLCRRPTRCCGRSRFTGRKGRPGGARQPSQWHLCVASCICSLHPARLCVASCTPVRCICRACCILRQRVGGQQRLTAWCATVCRAMPRCSSHSIHSDRFGPSAEAVALRAPPHSTAVHAQPTVMARGRSARFRM